MSLSQPVAKKPKLSSGKQMNDLADADLSAIFERLPPYDRLIVSEVSRRWLGLSRKAWVDVKHLDLSRVCGKCIRSIIKQCPNLLSVVAFGKSFDFNELVCLSSSSLLSTVKLYDCHFAVRHDSDHRLDAFANIFGGNIRQASWSELIIHNARFEDKTVAASSGYAAPTLAFSARLLPTSLTRLQLSGLCITSGNWVDYNLFLNALDRFQNLECLILHTTPDLSCYTELIERAFCFCPYLFEKIGALKNLKELCIGPAVWYSRQTEVGRLIASLPKLEVLFLNKIDYVMFTQDLKDLITKKSVLRILVLSGGRPSLWNSPIDLPPRRRFPNGFGSEPLPLLHIFVGKSASERLRFSKSASDAAIIHPINEPMHRFLRREDIAPIFDGVWVAEKIKEAARNGDRLWDYHTDDTARLVQNIGIDI